MKYDLDRTFGQIFKNDVSALRSQLIDIQHHQDDRRAAERWREKGLRFIDISGVPKLKQRDSSRRVLYKNKTRCMYSGAKPLQVLPLSQQSDDDGTVGYVAVSWRWTEGDNQLPPWGCDVRESFDYQIQRPGEEPYKSEFPNHYLERVILFAQSQKIDKIWIDKECIYQRQGDKISYPNDFDLGMQIMDAVYGESSCAVGLLTTSLMHQHEVNTLDELLSQSIFVKPIDTEAPRYKPGLHAKLMEVQLLILRILSDDRWSRGWIFQEDHLASERMTLLIPYSEGIETKGLSYKFGTLPGNLRVKSHHLRQSVTMFCMASDESEFRWPKSEMLAKLKQYNMWNKEPYKTGPGPRNKRGVRLRTQSRTDGSKMNEKAHYDNESIYPSSTSSILHDLSNRSLSNKPDMVAIMANAAKFSTRLDIRPTSPLVKSDEYSLSAILLVLIVLNGEILVTNKYLNDNDIMRYTLRSYLEEVQYKFYVPMLKMKQSFIDRCRLKPSTITSHGIETQGFLYKLLPNCKSTTRSKAPNPLKLSAEDRRSLRQFSQDTNVRRIQPKGKFNPIAEQVILILIEKLKKCYGRGCRLANFLHRNLDLDRNPPPDKDAKPSTPYVQDMMVGIVQALIDGHELRFARLDSQSDSEPPSAIFIAPPYEHDWSSDDIPARRGYGVGQAWVFASWDNGWRNHSMERWASIEVAPFRKRPWGALKRWDDEGDEGNKLLRSYGWVNGVFDFKGRRMARYTFPFPGVSAVDSRGRGLKRNVADMLDGEEDDA